MTVVSLFLLIPPSLSCSSQLADKRVLAATLEVDVDSRSSQLPNVEAELRAKQRELAQVDRDLAGRMQVRLRLNTMGRDINMWYSHTDITPCPVHNQLN